MFNNAASGYSTQNDNLMLNTVLTQPFVLSSASFLNKCSRSDPQLNACLKKTFNNLKPYLARGIPEIGLPPMEPLKVDALGIENTAGNIRIKGVFSNVVNSGASNFTVKEVRSDLNVSALQCRCSFEILIGN